MANDAEIRVSVVGDAKELAQNVSRDVQQMVQNITSATSGLSSGGSGNALDAAAAQVRGFGNEIFNIINRVQSYTNSRAFSGSASEKKDILSGLAGARGELLGALGGASQVLGPGVYDPKGVAGPGGLTKTGIFDDPTTAKNARGAITAATTAINQEVSAIEKAAGIAGEFGDDLQKMMAGLRRQLAGSIWYNREVSGFAGNPDLNLATDPYAALHKERAITGDRVDIDTRADVRDSRRGDEILQAKLVAEQVDKERDRLRIKAESLEASRQTEHYDSLLADVTRIELAETQRVADVLRKRAGNQSYISSKAEQAELAAVERAAIKAQAGLGLDTNPAYQKSVAENMVAANRRGQALRERVLKAQLAEGDAQGAVTAATKIKAAEATQSAVVSRAMTDEQVRALADQKLASDELKARVKAALPPPVPDVALTPDQLGALQNQRKQIAQETNAAAIRARLAEGEYAEGAQLKVLQQQERNRQLRAEVNIGDDLYREEIEGKQLESQANAARRRRLQQLIREDPNVRAAVNDGTLYQRAQAWMKNRGPGGGGFGGGGSGLAFASDQPTFGNSIGSALLTTGRYAASGALFYGVTAGIRTAISEASEFERQLSSIRAQFDSLEQSGDFGGFKQSIIGISKETGVAATDVARVAFQMKGAFGDTEEAVDATTDAIRLSVTTGLELTEIIDSLTAAAKSLHDEYGRATDIETIGDEAFAIEERFGVLAKETLKVYGDIGSVADAAGLSIRELSVLTGALQQASGRPATAISEGLGRILPAMQENASKIIGLYQQIGDEQTAAEAAQQFALGKSGDVLVGLIRNWERFSDVQQDAVVSSLGGRREAQLLIPLFQNASTITSTLADNYDATGKSAGRFADVQDTLAQRVARFEAQLRALAQTLFDAGIGDALKAIVDIGALLAEGFTALLRLVGQIDEAFGGWGLELIATTAGILGVVKAVAALAAGIKALAAARAAAAGANLLGNFVAPVVGATSTVAAGTAVAGGAGLGASLAAGATALAPAAAIAGVAAGGYLLYQRARDRHAKEEALKEERLHRLTDANLDAAIAQQRQFESEVKNAPRTFANRNAPPQTATSSTGLSLEDLQSEQQDRFFRNSRATELKQGLSQLSDVGAPAEYSLAGDRALKDLKAQRAELTTTSTETVRAGRGIQQITTQVAANRTLLDSIIADGRITADELLQITDDRKAYNELTGEWVTNEDELASTLTVLEGLLPAGTELAKLVDAAIRRQLDSVSRAALELDEAKSYFDAGVVSYEDVLGAFDSDISAKELAAQGGDLDAKAAVAKAKEEKHQFVRDYLVNQATEIAELAKVMYGENSGQYQEALENVATVSAATEGSDPKEAIETAKAVNEAYDNQVRAIDEKADALQALGELSGGGPKSTVTAAAVAGRLRVFRDPKTKFANIEAKQKAALDIAKLVKKQADQTYEEAVKLGDEAAIQAAELGVELPEEITAQLLGVEFLSAPDLGGVYSALDGYAELISLASANAANIMNTTGASAQDAFAQALEKLIAGIDLALAGLGLAGNIASGFGVELPDFQALRDRRAALVDSLARLRSNGGGFGASSRTVRPTTRVGGGGGGGGGSDDAERAAEELKEARREAEEAAAQYDPVALARLQLKWAQEDAQTAETEAEKIRAATAELQANRALTDALQSVEDARREAAIAQANLEEDPVEAARLQMEQAQINLQRARDRGAGEAEIIGLQSAASQATEDFADAATQKQLDDQAFAYEMGQTTKQQYLAFLQSMLLLPNVGESLSRELQRQIKALQEELGQDYQYNLPTTLGIPTLYSARRINQLGSFDRANGGSGKTLNDNREITVYINVSGSDDPQAAVRMLRAEIERPPVVGNRVGAY